MGAAFFGKTEVVRILIDAGAHIEAKTNVSKRISIFTYIYVCVCVCGYVWDEGGERGILPSYCMISGKYHLILLLHFITICII